SIWRMMASTSVVFMSGSLISAISRTCLRVSWPTFSAFALGEPFSIPAAFLIRNGVGGLLSVKRKEPSLKTVISAGTMSPIRLVVRALYSLQKAIRLMPCCARAGPMGGAGLALPAGICNVTIALIFFAIAFYPSSGFLDFQEIQFHRRIAPEEVHHHPHLVFLRVDSGHRADEVVERPIDNTDFLADTEIDFHRRLLLLHAVHDLLDLFRPQGSRFVAHTHKAGDSRRIAHHIPRVFVHLHFDQQIAGKNSA